MKARNIFALLGLSVAMGVGAFAFASTAKVKETKAVDTTVYCKMTYDWWKADGAAIGAYYWKSSDGDDHNTWPGARMTPVENDTDVWKFVIPEGYDKVIFTRINGSGEVADWGAKTGDLDVPTDDKILYTISSSDPVWGGSSVSGSWGTYEEPVPEEKSWMVRFQFNAGIASQEFSGEFENRFTGAILHLWGDGLNYSDAYVAEKMFSSSGQDYYAVNVSFTDSQVVRGAQWEVTRDGAANAQSVDIQKFGAHDNTTLTKDTPYDVILWIFGETWAEVEPGNFKFNLYSEEGSGAANDIWLDWQDKGAGSFSQDPVNNVFVFRNYTPNSVPSYIGIRAGTDNVPLRTALRAMATPESWRYLTKGGSDSALYLNSLGYYDFVLGNASFAVKKHVGPHTSYIYYVSNSEEATIDYIYAWDELDNHQFGDYPGSAIATVGEDVTGVVSFEGTYKKIYKIPVTLGFPENECHFMWNNGTDEIKSSTYLMADGAAYWWNGGTNLDAGASLDLIFRIEDLRNAVPAGDYKQFSICGISKSDAATVVNTYNDLSDASRAMVNSSTTYTYNPSGEEGQINVTFRDIVVELGKIAEIEVVGSPRTIIGNNNGVAIESTTLIAIISIIALVSISSIVVLVVIKKRKHN